MVPALIQLLAEVVDDTFRSAVCLRWHGDIHTGDLSNLHDGQPDLFYTCKNLRQDASDRDHKKDLAPKGLSSYLKQCCLVVP